MKIVNQNNQQTALSFLKTPNTEINALVRFGTQSTEPVDPNEEIKARRRTPEYWLGRAQECLDKAALLFQQGEKADKAGDKDAAALFVRDAWQEVERANDYRNRAIQLDDYPEDFN